MDKLSKAVQHALQSKEVKDRIAALGGEPFQGSMEESAKFVAAELQRMGKLVKERSITTE